MKITDITFLKLTGEYTRPFFPPGDRQAQMLDVYPEFNAQDWSKTQPDGNREIQAIYLEINTDTQFSGLFGPIEDEQAYIIQKFLRPFLIGRDPLATETLYDQMIRLHRHGRSGFFMTAVSPVDCALWDLKGKVYNQPIFRLLGGPTRPSIPAYASMLGYSVQPEEAVTIAQQFKEFGYTAQKWFFRYGPGDGEKGKILNINLVKALRDSLGPYYTLMFDAYMGWDVAYASEMIHLLEPYNLTWLEEPIPPERVGGFRHLRSIGKVPITTGEHVYTRWQVKELLCSEAVDVIQTDPDWTGGITELVKICALASAFDKPVVAHGHSLLAALHVAGSQSPNTVPMIEYLVRFQPEKQFFHKPVFQPENGVVKLPDLPGLGTILDETKISKKVRVIFDYRNL